MLAELEVLRTRDKMPITVIRPSAVYGPRDRDMFQYFKVVNSGIEPFFGFGKKYLNLVHVHDLVDGIVLAALHPGGENETMFIGSEINYSLGMSANQLLLHCAAKRFGLLFHTHLFTLSVQLQELLAKSQTDKLFLTFKKPVKRHAKHGPAPLRKQ